MTVPHDYLQAFWQTMRDHGLAPEEPPQGDELLHRFYVDGDKPESLNGWYCFFPDGVPRGVFGSWRLGFKEHWCAKPARQLPPAEHLENKQRTAEVKRRREQATMLLCEMRNQQDEFPASRHQTLVSCLSRLGMTPADRYRVVVPKTKKNKFDRGR